MKWKPVSMDIKSEIWAGLVMIALVILGGVAWSYAMERWPDLLVPVQDLLRHSLLWRVVAGVLLTITFIVAALVGGITVSVWRDEGWDGIAKMFGGLILGLFQWGCLALVIAFTFLAVRAVVRFFG